MTTALANAVADQYKAASGNGLASGPGAVGIVFGLVVVVGIVLIVRMVSRRGR